MSSKTSFFNVRIYKHTLSRFWLISLAYPAVYVFRLLQVINVNSYALHSSTQEIGMRLISESTTSVYPMVAAVAMAMAVYGWMYRTRSAAFVMALPLRREEVFVSNMAAGLTLLLAGNVLTVLATAVLGAGNGNLLPYLALWMAITSLLCVAYFGFATFCATLTGSLLILPAVYMVLLYSAVALEATLRRIAQFLIFGLSGQRWKVTVLSPAYHLRILSNGLMTYDWVYSNNYSQITNLRFHGWGLISAYAAAGLVFAGLAVLLIRKRRMETAGAVVAVPSLRKVFRWCAAAAVSLSAGLMTLQMVFGYNGYQSPGGSPGQVVLLVLMMLLGGFVGWFGAQGLMMKTVRVFDRGWKGFGFFCAAVCALVFGLEADVLGVEKHLPNIDNVASAQVVCYYSSVNGPTFRDEENIAAVMEFQRHVIANKKAFEQRSSISGLSGGALEIRYYDEDGGLLLSRSYAAPAGEYAWASKGNAYYTSYGNAVWGSKNPVLAELQELVNRPEAVKARMVPEFPVDAPGTTVEFSTASLVENGYNTDSISLTASEAMDVYINCILPDMEDGLLGQLRLLPEEDSSLSFVGLRISFVYRRAFNDSPQWHYLDLYGIPREAWRTTAWLVEHGLHIYGRGSGEGSDEPDVNWSATFDMDPLEGLGLVLEKVYQEYDPDTAGAVVSVRWARMLLDQYIDQGENPYKAYDQVRKFARRYDVRADGFSDALERLRAAGEQLANGELGLVREPGSASYDLEQVQEMFDAIYAGTGLEQQ